MHGQSSLFYAAKTGRLEICEILIDAGADIHLLDNKKLQAVHIAQKHKKNLIVDLLVQKGASSPVQKNNDIRRAVSKPKTDKKTDKKYVLTATIDGFQIPLSQQEYDEKIAQIEKELPEIAAIFRDPGALSLLKIPEISESAPIFDHWEKAASKIVSYLVKRDGVWLFLEPVDAKAWGIEDYYDLVKTPMDFQTVKTKLKRADPNGGYTSVEQFIGDVNQIFENCLIYNGVSHKVFNEIRKIANMDKLR